MEINDNAKMLAHVFVMAIANNDRFLDLKDDFFLKKAKNNMQKCNL
jgi:hypothetical protein